MIFLFWTLLFCDGSQQVVYTNPGNGGIDTTAVYSYTQGSADGMIFIPNVPDLYTCGYWTITEDQQ